MKKILIRLSNWFWNKVIDWILAKMVYLEERCTRDGDWLVSYEFQKPINLIKVHTVPRMFRRDQTDPTLGIFNYTKYELNNQWLFRNVKLNEAVTVDMYILARDIPRNKAKAMAKPNALAHCEKVKIEAKRIVDLEVSIVNRNSIVQTNERQMIVFLIKRVKGRMEELKPGKAQRKPRKIRAIDR